jgi:putative transposase
MKKEPGRRSIRLPDFDYRRPGWYFVTICTEGRVRLFGDVLHGEVHLTPEGRIVDRQVRALPRQNRRVELDAFVVMPDHVHLIIGLAGAAGNCPGQTVVVPGDGRSIPAGTAPGSLAAVVQNLKSVTSRHINRHRGTPGERVWQRNYWERIIRTGAAHARIRRYVMDNPAKWPG